MAPPPPQVVVTNTSDYTNAVQVINTTNGEQGGKNGVLSATNPILIAAQDQIEEYEYDLETTV